MKIAVLPGDGIGPEIIAQALRVLDVLKAEGLPIETETGLIGGCAVDATGVPLPDATLKLALEADAVLLGALGERRSAGNQAVSALITASPISTVPTRVAPSS